MPWYLTRGRRVIPSGNAIGNMDNMCDVYCNTKFIEFIDKITDKLYDVVDKVKNDMNKLECAANGRVSNGAILAEITPPKQTVGVKQEYLIYIQRYGPPKDGIFDESKLNAIKLELSI